jgi:hypothetical protein
MNEIEHTIVHRLRILRWLIVTGAIWQTLLAGAVIALLLTSR